MEGLNRVMLLGNLGSDPEYRVTQGGQSVLNLRLATSEKYLDRDKQRQERTEWHNVVIWGNRADALSKILTKGSRIYVEGALRTTSYEKDGGKRYKTEIVASNILLQGGAAGIKQERGSSRPGRMGSMPPPPRMPSVGFPDMPEDDLPF